MIGVQLVPRFTLDCSKLLLLLLLLLLVISQKQIRLLVLAWVEGSADRVRLVNILLSSLQLSIEGPPAVLFIQLLHHSTRHPVLSLRRSTGMLWHSISQHLWAERNTSVRPATGTFCGRRFVLAYCVCGDL
jgi:hypothetical protein